MHSLILPLPYSALAIASLLLHMTFLLSVIVQWESVFFVTGFGFKPYIVIALIQKLELWVV
jgi:hypothetical protein